MTSKAGERKTLNIFFVCKFWSNFFKSLCERSVTAGGRRSGETPPPSPKRIGVEQNTA